MNRCLASTFRVSHVIILCWTRNLLMVCEARSYGLTVLTFAVSAAKSQDRYYRRLYSYQIHCCFTSYSRSGQFSIDKHDCVIVAVSMLYSTILHRFCWPGPPFLVGTEGGMRIPIAAAPGVLDFTSSILLFARLIPGITQSPQLQCMPCHAYLPTFVLHFGHSSRPSSLPCSSSGRIQESGSTK